MGRYHSHINSALKLLQLYKGEMPFSTFIKQFFSKEKKYGSKDRKQIAALCYSYFRVGLVFKKQLSEENLLKTFFLVNDEPSLLIQELKPEWNESISKPIEEKIKLLNELINIHDIFSLTTELNDTIDVELFYKSFLLQPSLFVRIRPQNKNAVIEKIKAAAVEHLFLNDCNSVQFSPGIRIEKLLVADKEIVIQDYNSQQVLNYIKENNSHFEEKEIAVWDCCAASGGKSILIYDLLNGKINLTVSDIRQSIIANLQQRFKNAGIKGYHHFIADISDETKKNPALKYDIIICEIGRAHV